MANLGMRKPFDKAHGRDYKDEYARYQGTSEQKVNRAARNGARATLAKTGAVKKGDGKDVDHKRSIRNGGGNSVKNLRAISKSKNRGFPRNSDNKPTGAA
jgi:5-methylcytosine-specific restriction endonuclease McrA